MYPTVNMTSHIDLQTNTHIYEMSGISSLVKSYPLTYFYKELKTFKLSLKFLVWKHLWKFPHMLNSHQVDDRHNTTVSN